MKRRTLSLILAIVLCFGFTVSAVAADNSALVWKVAPTLEFETISYNNEIGYYEQKADSFVYYGGDDSSEDEDYGDYDARYFYLVIDPKTGKTVEEVEGHQQEEVLTSNHACLLSYNGINAYFIISSDGFAYTPVGEDYIVKQSQNRTMEIEILIPTQDSGFNEEIFNQMRSNGFSSIDKHITYFSNLTESRSAICVNGKMVTDFIYLYVDAGSEVAFVNTFANIKKAIVGMNGTRITDFIYDDIGWYPHNKDTAYYPVSKAEKWGVVDKTGKELIPFIFEHAVYIDADTAFAKINGKYGILDVKKTIAALAASDMPSSWAVEQVNAAIAAKLVPESLQSKYTQATTRSEFCALAVALYENVTGKTITERKTFDDTKDVNVEKAAAISVVNGVGGNKFDPNASLTREQAAAMLSRLADAVGKPLAKKAATFADNSKISNWAAEFVGQIQAAEIMSGVGDNTFAPQDPYTREQSILTIMRLYGVVK